MITKIDNKEYRIYYIVRILYNSYKFLDLDSACTFIKYCTIGCTDINDLSDVTIKIDYEEVE